MRWRLMSALSLAMLAAPSYAGPASCTNGVANGHACERIDFVARLDTATLGYGDLNDVWGWTDPLSGREYALVGAVVGTVFVDITDPANPRIVGRLPAHENIGPSPGAIACKTGGDGCGGNSSWRNIKVYADHAFVGSESAGHGLQVFDLTQLRAFPPGSPIERFGETAHYSAFGHSHTIWIDAASGFLYAVGSDTFNGGPHFVDISTPTNPVAAGGYAADGYSHEILCQVYAGPDVTYTGRQICIASNEDTLTILDVTNKGSPVQLARVGYPGVGYTHQGSLTADQRYLFVNDELDERDTGERTRTLVWDLADLNAPLLVDQILQPRFVIDHNLYLHQGFMYQSDYTAGLVVYDARDPRHAFELGYFDTHPSDDFTQFDGTWSNYPFFASGVVAVSDITRGLYLVRPQFGATAEDARVVAASIGPQVDFTFALPSDAYVSFSVGPDARIDGLSISPANFPLDCMQTQQTFRCRFPASPGGVSVQIDASAPGGGSTLAVVMIAGSGDETAPADNRVSAFIPVSASASSGGGGAASPWLLLVLAAAALVRRRLLALGLTCAAAVCSAGEPVPAALPELIANFHQVTATLATAGAPVAADMAMLKAAGYTLVIDLRTPEEGLEAERAAAAAVGLTWINVPVTRVPERAQLEALSAVLDAHPAARTLVHCATNKRASSMVMLDQVTRRGVPLADARKHVDALWAPSPTWEAFIDATLAAPPASIATEGQETRK